MTPRAVRSTRAKEGTMGSTCPPADCAARRKRRLVFVGLFCALLITPTLLGACGATTPKNAGYFIEISYDLAYLEIAAQAGNSDIVITGKVVRQDPSRWNTADGKRAGEESLAYTTYHLEPTEVLQGELAWGTPVAIRAIGGTLPDGHSFRVNGASNPMKVDDEVIVFGTTRARWGSEAVYVPAEAYWLTAEANSVWIKEADSYLAQGYVETEADRSLTLEEFKAELAAASAEE